MIAVVVLPLPAEEPREVVTGLPIVACRTNRTMYHALQRASGGLTADMLVWAIDRNDGSRWKAYAVSEDTVRAALPEVRGVQALQLRRCLGE